MTRNNISRKTLATHLTELRDPQFGKRWFNGYLILLTKHNQMCAVLIRLASSCLNGTSVDSSIIHFSRICVQYAINNLVDSKVRIYDHLPVFPVRENYFLV